MTGGENRSGQSQIISIYHIPDPVLDLLICSWIVGDALIIFKHILYFGDKIVLITCIIIIYWLSKQDYCGNLVVSLWRSFFWRGHMRPCVLISHWNKTLNEVLQFHVERRRVSEWMKRGREDHIFSCATSYTRQQSSLASQTFLLIVLPLWDPLIVSHSENDISGVHVRTCPCTTLRCLWMLGPHRHSCDWSLSE